MKDEDIAFVSNAGNHKRLIARVGAVYYVGCFQGGYYKLIERIKKEYVNPSDYLNKVEELKKAKLSDFKDVQADDNYALIFAAHYGKLKIVKYLVKNGADVQADDNYALRGAEVNGHTEVVEYLKKKINN